MRVFNMLAIITSAYSKFPHYFFIPMRICLNIAAKRRTGRQGALFFFAWEVCYIRYAVQNCLENEIAIIQRVLTHQLNAESGICIRNNG